MIDINIPPVVVEAAARANYEAWRDYNGVRDYTQPWEDIGDVDQEAHRGMARAALAAGLAVWPEIVEARSVRQLFPNCIVLPLPQEPRT